ncbi:hypothetical protein ENBRE01_0027 [Enteropsectra breve]|nr:hypothetical protein ENBRE01_0027 [Enteropsectra breve]
MTPMIFPKEVKDLTYKAVVNKEIVDLKLTDVSTKYIALVFYPLDFTFVCPTEIIKISEMYEDFKNTDTSVFFVSGDSVYSHLAWINAKQDEGGIGGINWPMVSDTCFKLSTQFNLYNAEQGTVCRSTVIMDKKLNVKHISANIDPIGRSAKEILRLIRAIDFNQKHGEVCPVDFESK